MIHLSGGICGRRAVETAATGEMVLSYGIYERRGELEGVDEVSQGLAGYSELGGIKGEDGTLGEFQEAVD